MRRRDLETTRCFGVEFAIGTMEEALEAIDRLCQEERTADGPALCAFVNAHCFNIAVVDAGYRAALAAMEYVWADGVGAALAARRQGRRARGNVNGTDMLPLLCRRGFRIALLGGRPGVAEAAMARLNAAHPGRPVVAAHDGYFREEECAEALAGLAAAKPDLLLVGMGVPLQELWMLRHREGLPGKVAIGVGGLLDFASGRIPRAPQWMRRLRLEWVYRLWQEPRRLFRRYVLGNPLFLWRLLWNADAD